ncbi:hypothetical protein OIU74_027868 [Salix koriyanagi]|uniref:Uncharacterized protein n=1 Tax=Salix koriyanagi TaxID=2511006 RepID=A0A9Q0VQF7_9ROSI|nr:hypothetical protein OIU74_027868 [Salix koriyanagi]
MVAAITISCPKSTVLQNPTSLKDPCSSFFGGSLKGVPFQLKPGNKRLDSFSLVVAAASNTPTTTSTSSSSGGGGRFYLNFTGFPFPLGPFLNRRTIRTEAVKGCIWLFEQEQALGFSSVSTNIRMTVIKLKSGGLWVHAPIAPTEECIQLLKELGAPVEYIVLPTFAYEHKIFVGPFSRKFPRAQIWVAPRQWSWPLNLPLEFFGIFRAKTLKDEDMSTPWGWERMVLQILFLGPSNLLEPNASFAQMSQKLIVSPIVKTLVFSKVPEKVRDWIDSIVRDWKFKRIIPAHFAAPINAGSQLLPTG